MEMETRIFFFKTQITQISADEKIIKLLLRVNPR